MTNIIPQKQRYLPHTLDTKYHAVKFYRKGYSVNFVCRKYKISKRSLMRWNKKFDGTRESLIDKSHRPRTPRHNGKVERSHRNDVNRFYNHLSFFDFNDLLVQMKRYLYKSNRLPMQILGWISLIEMRNFIINNFSS